MAGLRSKHGRRVVRLRTGKTVPAGTTTAPAPIDKIPLLVRAGSIVPFGPVEQYAKQTPPGDLEVRVYPGANGDFVLYEDEGTNYNYEQGARSTISFHWDNRTKGAVDWATPGKLSGNVAVTAVSHHHARIPPHPARSPMTGVRLRCPWDIKDDGRPVTTNNMWRSHPDHSAIR